MPIYTVSQVTGYLRDFLEQDELLANLWISGEVSNFKTYRSGHSYFTLKDSEAQLRSVMFKGGRGAALLSEGSLVTAHGRVSFYEPRGDVQLIADLVMPEGTGPLFLELERLKMRLEEEGLFEPSRKRPLPSFPRVVGLVTSPSGAVFQDICNVIGRRYPLAEILLAPTPVQGDGAAPGIVYAIQALNEDGRSDVIIVARGGGSMEELWPFNEEVVARAIYASHVPVVSAVGHERDYTIADYVADLRAPTPSAAAELAVPDIAALTQEARAYGDSLVRAMSYELATRRRGVEGLTRQVRGRAPDVDGLSRRVGELGKAATTALSSRLSLSRERASGLKMRLEALNPGAILERGYATVQKVVDESLVSRTGHVSSGDALKVTVSDGSFPATAYSAPRKGRSRKSMVRAGARLV